MGQTDLKPTAQGQVESSINDTINFIMAKVAAGEIDAATATELIAAARKDYESNVPVTTSAQQAVQPQQTANPYQADPQTACVICEQCNYMLWLRSHRFRLRYLDSTKQKTMEYLSARTS